MIRPWSRSEKKDLDTLIWRILSIVYIIILFKEIFFSNIKNNNKKWKVVYLTCNVYLKINKFV